MILGIILIVMALDVVIWLLLLSTLAENHANNTPDGVDAIIATFLTLVINAAFLGLYLAIR